MMGAIVGVHDSSDEKVFWCTSGREQTVGHCMPYFTRGEQGRLMIAQVVLYIERLPSSVEAQ